MGQNTALKKKRVHKPVNLLSGSTKLGIWLTCRNWARNVGSEEQVPGSGGTPVGGPVFCGGRWGTNCEFLIARKCLVWIERVWCCFIFWLLDIK